jgi:hypothetical protein
VSVRPYQPDFLGEWAAALRPDFAGRGAGGRFMVVLSARSELDAFFWAIGHSETSLLEAREIAVAEMARQRFDQEVGLLLAKA